MRLLPDIGATIEAGRIAFLGKDLVQLPRADMRHLRGKELSMIFQEPGTSLNPVYRVGAQVAEAILLHEPLDRVQAMNRTRKLFEEEVGIPDPTDVTAEVSSRDVRWTEAARHDRDGARL